MLRSLKNHHALNRTILELKLKLSKRGEVEVLSQSYHIGIEICYINVDNTAEIDSQSYHIGIEMELWKQANARLARPLNRTILELK